MSGVVRALKSPLRRIKRRVMLEVNLPTNFGKTDIIHLIARRLGLRDYLEICTTTTGNCYAEINRGQFRSSRRLMYNCPDGYDDGLPVDHRIADLDIDPALATIEPGSIDICLVDGWHTYDCAIRDLTGAYNLLPEGGALVVHDCLPTSEALAAPQWVQGEWCGMSHRAFLDFVLARRDLDFCTIDIDYGCGIIFKNRAISLADETLPAHDRTYERTDLAAGWFAHHGDDGAAFKFFMDNHRELLRLIPARTFVRKFNGASVRVSAEHSPASSDSA